MRLHLLLLDAADTFSRRKLYFLIPFLGILLGAIVTAYLLPEEYEAQVTVMAGAETGPAGSPPAEFAMFRELVGSRPVLEAVVDTLLAGLPDSARPPRAEALAGFAETVRTEPRGTDGCRVIVTHRDPRSAVRIVEVLTAAALRAGRQADMRRLDEAVAFYEQRLEAEGRASGGGEAGSGRQAAAGGSALRASIVRAADDLRRMEAAAADRGRELALVQYSRGSLDDPEVLERLGAFETPFSAARAAEIRALARRYALMLERYRPAHPEARAVRRQLEGLVQRSADGLERERQRLEAEVTQVRGRIRALGDQLAALPADTAASARSEAPPGGSIDLRRRLEEARIARDLRAGAGSRMVILAPPELPAAPVRPDRPLFIGLGFLVGLLVGLAAAAVGEALDPTIRRARDLDVFGKPIIATLS